MRLSKRLIKLLLGIIVGGLLLLLGLILLLYVWHNQPVDLPVPTGPYAVGRVGYDWIDSTRLETLSDRPHEQRELMVWVWYPASPPTSMLPTAPYLPASWAQDGGISAFLRRNPNSVHVHAMAGAALSPAQPSYPVLILQPGLGPIMTDYTALAEELASQGYVVVGSTPTYSANFVVFSDGRIASRTTGGNPPDSATPAESNRLLNRLIAIWAADDRFVLNQVAMLNSTQSQFTGHLNVQAVGVLGHSFGGATAAEVCHLDPRFKVGVDLDGSLYGDVVQQGLTRPFMFIWSQPTGKPDAEAQQAAHDVQIVFDSLPHGSYQLTIAGTRHFNFADYAVMDVPLLKLVGGLGPINGQRGLKISADYTRAFFDTYLKGIPSPLLKGSSADYPEVQFQSR